MNRSITLLGVAVLLLAVGLIASPIILTGVESLTLLLEIGVFGLPVAITTILWGASSPDPNLTTVGGVFGNQDENVLRARARSHQPTRDVRYLPGPRESVNCRVCYTLVPWDVAECPRCGHRRECRTCGRPLFHLSGAVRCTPCARNEPACNCPVLKRAPAPARGIRR
ncbi:MAG TPA: hypothetical protein VMH78_07580 [Thermoplasmata archaeon]|nr:hypothetical protein [Thermoplasmata archaeon]